MGGEDNFSGFKVIKRIPLSKSISKDSSSLKNNIIKHNTEKNKSSKKLEKFDVVLPEDKKINSSLLKDYSGVKKFDLKVDTSDIEEKYKDFNPFRKKEVSLENEKKKVDLSNSYLKENSLEKVNSVDKINDVKETKPDISKKASFEKDSLKSSFEKDSLKSSSNTLISSKANSELLLPDSSNEFLLEETSLKNKEKSSLKVTPNIEHVDNSIKKDINFDESNNNKKTMSLLKDILENVSKPKEFSEINDSKDIFTEVKSKDENVDDLLDQLNKKTSKLNQEVYLESFSFLDDKPKKSKIDFPKYDVKNLYSKIDHLSENKNKFSSDNTSLNNSSNLSKKTDQLNVDSKKINSTSNNSPHGLDDGLFEEIEVPDIFAIEDDVKDLSSTIEDKYSVYDKDSKEELKVLNDDPSSLTEVQTNESYEKIPNFVIDNNQVKLNSEIEKNISRLKKSKPSDKDEKFDVNILNNKVNKDEEDVKKVFSNVDLSKEDDERIYKGMREISSPKNKKNKPKISNKNKEYISPSTREEKLTSKEDYSDEDIDEKNISKTIKKEPLPKEQEIKIIKEVKLTPKVKNDLIAEKFKDLREKGMDYILPKDAGKNPVKINKEIYQEKLSTDNSLFSSLVYQDPIASFEENIKNIFDKYSIDDFTYVTIYYDNNKGLFYNLVQPELNSEQEKEYIQLKKIFFNTIDKNYYSFNGDKHSLDKYIQKIFDISVEKLSYSLGKLQQKLYLKFIQREFFGLGILTNLLLDKKIIEVSCSGEKSNLIVYHVEYGVLKTNISFKDITELNNFVTILTKNMGIYITPEHPVIDGYLPNGYKVEGLYSLGDTSSKGSSFVIKKYLDEPLTPVALVNTSIGSVDVFSYIWSAISENYKVILHDVDDSFVIYNSILLFYPDQKIITVQAYDRFKLPQKEWINRIFTNNADLSKRLIIEQTISQKPDIIAIDEFGEDIFDVSWYNLNIFSIKPNVADKFIEQLKMVNQKSILIEIKRIKQGFKETYQIVNIKEIINKNESVVVDLEISENKYNINLLSSSINVVDFLKKKKLMRWMKDSKVYNYKDFNSIISQYNYEKDELFKRLDIK
jgi:type IV secretory pathway ATPase VirB11/archaellum biosynthesis ATPase